MKTIQNMDKKWNLWQEATGDENGKDHPSNGSVEDSGNKENLKDDSEHQKSDEGTKEDSAKCQDEYAKLEESGFGKLTPLGPVHLSHKFNGLNPLLENITDYLVEEGSAEEEELLTSKPASNNQEKHRSGFDIEIDRDYTKVLDKLILYLRVVHSIDFYNSIEYQQEDSMPNRCGIMFVRPAVPSNAASASLKVTQEEVNQYIKQFEVKIKPYVDYKDKIDVDMAKKLGIKDRREEIEKFIKTNTQELAPDRWLCPLSGKRFKGPEFIRKHLFYKHIEKIVEVKKECEYFNNYVFDPKRPQLPEHPTNRPHSQTPGQGQSQSYQQQSGYQGHQGGMAQGLG